MADMDDFKKTFFTECFELLENMKERLMSLSENASGEDLNAVFRCAHSIKGGAGTFGFEEITRFTHAIETMLDNLRCGKLAVSQMLIDLLLRSKNIMFQMVTTESEGGKISKSLGADILKQLKDIEAGKVISAAPAASGAAPGATPYTIAFTPHPDLFTTGNDPLLIFRQLAEMGTITTLECCTDKLPVLDCMEPAHCYLSWRITLETAQSEAALREVFEFVEGNCDLSITSSASAAPAPLPPVGTEPAPAETKAAAKKAGAASIRVDIDKLDRLINMVGELVITQSMMHAQLRRLSPDACPPELMQGVDDLSQHTRELQEAVMSVRMQPVHTLFSRMPRIVRDLSQQLGKDIQLVMSGEETEVGKTIIEQLADPLTHMIRNSVDHGIEMPDVRAGKGKSPQGRIHLAAGQRGGKIFIEITDDGGGINRTRVLAKAREKGIVPENAELSESEIDNLIFLPGFSTAEKITNVSGRGVGMDVVRRNIEDIGGSVHIKNSANGSVFCILLPLTLAILDGMIVRAGAEHYIVPIAAIVESLRPQKDEIRQIAGANDLIRVRGDFIPLVYLHRVFGVKNAVTDPAKCLVILVESGQEKFGLVVDDLLGQQQVVIKSLEANYRPMDGVSGATILGDGKVSLILDVAKLQGGGQCHGKDADAIAA